MGRNKTTAEQPGSRTESLDLEAVVRGLYVSDIRVGIQTSDAGLQVWISDRLHRVRAERLFDLAGAEPWREDSAALWLHKAALRLFPENAYARRFREGMIEQDDGVGPPASRTRAGPEG